MAAPSYVTAGAGVTITTGSSAVTISGVAVGDVIILQILEDGAAGYNGLSSVSGVQNLGGVANTMTALGNGGVGGASEGWQYLLIGRATSTSISMNVATTGTDLYARLYAFRGVDTGSTLGTVIENNTTGSYTQTSDTTTTINQAGVTTLSSNRLCVQFVAVNDDNALDAFTGMSGGTWAEAVAEYASATGTDGALGLQTATLSSAGSITGGSDTMAAADAWGVLGFAFRPPNQATLASTHTRFRNDNGSETTATWKAAADTAPTDIQGTGVFRLRYDVAETSGLDPSPTGYQFEVQKNGGAWGSLGTGKLLMFNSSNFSHGDATTQQITAGGTFEAGQMLDVTHATSAGPGAGKITEYEVCLQADLVAGDTFAIRVIRADTSAVLITTPTVTVASSGTAWSQTPSDTITLSDAAVKAIKPGKADTITLSDAISRVWAAKLSSADTITLADTPSKKPGLVKADTITLSDLLTKVTGKSVSLSDTINLSDVVAKKAGLGKADTITLTDNATRAWAALRSLADSVTLTDAISNKPGLTKADTLTLSDLISKKPGVGRSDTITLSDAIGKLFGKPLSDTVTLSDIASKKPGLGKADTITLSDAANKAEGLGKSDVITLSDTISKKPGIGRADTITLVDAVGKTYGVSLGDSIVLSDLLLKSMGITRGDVITLSDVITPLLTPGGGGLTLSLSDTIVLTDTIAKNIALTKAEQITLADNLAKAVSITRADAVTLTDALGKAMKLAKSDNLTMTDAIAKAFGISEADAITLSDAFTMLLNGQPITEPVSAAARMIVMHRFGIY